MPFIPTPPPKDVLDRMSPEMRSRIVAEYRVMLESAEHDCGGNARYGMAMLIVAIAIGVLAILLLASPLSAADVAPWLPALKDSPEHEIVKTFDGWAGGAYGDTGFWSYLRWRIEQTPESLTRAIERNTLALEASTAYIERSGDRNHTREHTVWFAFAGIELWPHMDQPTRDKWATHLRVWKEHCLRYTDLADTDEVLGHRIGVAGIAKVLGEDEREYRFHNPFDGHFDVARADATIAEWIRFAEGGEWLAGPGYNSGDLSILFLGNHLLGLKWPGLPKLANEVIEQEIWTTTSNLAEAVPYSDVDQDFQHARKRRRASLLGLAIAVGGDPGDRGKHFIKRTWIDPGAWQFWYWRYLISIDPRTLPEVATVDNPQGMRLAPHVGLLIARRGDQLFAAHQPTNSFHVHHGVPYGLPSVQYWDGQEWVLRSSAGGATHYNTAIAVFPSFADRFLERATYEGGVVRIGGKTNGAHRPWGWQPRPFCLLALRDARFDWETLKTANVAEFSHEPPRDDPATDGYVYDFERDTIRNSPANLVETWRTYGRAEKTADGWQWSTPRGKVVSLKTTATEAIVEDGFLRLLAHGLNPTIDSEVLVGTGVPVPPPVIEPPPPPPPPVDPPPTTQLDRIEAMLQTLLKRRYTLEITE
jgi:hypothetical protein